ncbi:MAG: TlpA disulfide reductase family protein [Pyrinomonadaceae bacterium]
MRVLALILVLSFVVTASAQSGRMAATDTATAASETTIREMFDEVNGYIRAKGAEYDAKKIFFSDRLFAQAKLEQRQMAARYATLAGARKDLAGEDLYYLGMLHWVAENLDGTVDTLRKFIALDGADIVRRQTARSIVIVVLAKQKKLDEAETLLAEYLKTEPTKLTEKARIEGEIAKAYQVQKQFTKMAPHAEASYAASKALIKDASSRARGLDEILDAGMLVYEAYRDSGERQKAEAALDDMRAVAVETTSPSFYYYAVDQKIKFLVETGRKPAALQLYQSALKEAEKDFTSKGQLSDVLTRLKKKQKHYALLGEVAPEMPLVDQWFPGTKKTLAELRGKVVLLDFWATWCGPCFDAFPHLNEWQQELGSQGFEVLGITRYYGNISGVVAEPLAEIEYFKRFRTREKLNYDIVVGKDQSIQLLYGATALPTAVLIDRKGVIRYIETGTSDSRIEQMREMVYKLVAEK